MLPIKDLRKATSALVTQQFERRGSSKYLFTGMIFLIFLLSENVASGQLQRRNTHRQATYRIKKSFKNFEYKSLGFSLSSLNYFGDLAPAPKRISTDLSQTRPAYTFSFEHRKGPRFSYRATFTYGTIRGSDSGLGDDVESALANDNLTQSYYRYRRNTTFKNHIKELSVNFTFDFIENNNVYLKRPFIAPYVFTGIALFHHNPKAKIPARDVHGNALEGAGEWVALQPLGTEGQHAKLLDSDANFGIRTYRLLQPSIPIGVGARLKYSNRVNIFCEFSFRYLFTDYIDDVSRNYVDLGVFDNEVARVLSYRGNEMPNRHPYTYTGRDGNAYTVEAGFGSEHSSNIRGNKNDNDMLFLFTFGGALILEPHRRAKFR